MRWVWVYLNQHFLFRSNPILLYAAGIGVSVGVVSTAYYFALQLGFWLIGFVIPNAPNPAHLTLLRGAWFVPAIGGWLVALTVRYLGAPSSTNEIIDEIHKEGRVNYRKVPSMIVTSLLSLSFGASVGPEAPVLDISSGVSSWVGEKLNLPKRQLRILTFCGMGAGLGAFFGSPLGSTLLALEFPHQMGLEYYEALVPTLLSSIVGFMIFRLATGLTIGGEYQFPPYPNLQHIDLFYAVLLGVIGALVAKLVMVIFRATHCLAQSLSNRPILLNTLGGLLIGCIATVLPMTLFFGEQQIQDMINAGTKLGAGMLLLITLGKILTFSISLNSGFRGGYIFALFFIGAAVGEAISLIFPAISPAVAIVSLMTSVTTALVRTPISIIIITSTLAHTELVPIVAISAMTSFLFTTEIALISTQRPRQLLDQ
jgi:H+/Cl- antiporter ClcA